MQKDYDSNMNRGKFPTTFVVIAAAVIAVAVILMAALAYFSSGNSYYGNGYYGGMMGGGGGYSMIFMIPIGLIVLFIIGYAIWRGFGWGGGYSESQYRHNASVEDRETAMQILQRRYAKGEITKEQFDQMKRDIVG